MICLASLGTVLSAYFILAANFDALPQIVERCRRVDASTSVLHELQVSAQSLASAGAIEDGTAARVAEQVLASHKAAAQ